MKLLLGIIVACAIVFVTAIECILIALLSRKLKVRFETLLLGMLSGGATLTLIGVACHRRVFMVVGGVLLFPIHLMILLGIFLTAFRAVRAIVRLTSSSRN